MKVRLYTVKCDGLWHEGFETIETATEWAGDNAGGFYEVFSYEVDKDDRPTIPVSVDCNT
jgi:hypothetical protein